MGATSEITPMKPPRMVSGIISLENIEEVLISDLARREAILFVPRGGEGSFVVGSTKGVNRSDTY